MWKVYLPGTVIITAFIIFYVAYIKPPAEARQTGHQMTVPAPENIPYQYPDQNQKNVNPE